MSLSTRQILALMYLPNMKKRTILKLGQSTSFSLSDSQLFDILDEWDGEHEIKDNRTYAVGDAHPSLTPILANTFQENLEQPLSFEQMLNAEPLPKSRKTLNLERPPHTDRTDVSLLAKSAEPLPLTVYPSMTHPHSSSIAPSNNYQAALNSPLNLSPESKPSSNPHQIATDDQFKEQEQKQEQAPDPQAINADQGAQTAKSLILISTPPAHGQAMVQTLEQALDQVPEQEHGYSISSNKPHIEQVHEQQQQALLNEADLLNKAANYTQTYVDTVCAHKDSEEQPEYITLAAVEITKVCGNDPTFVSRSNDSSRLTNEDGQQSTKSNALPLLQSSDMKDHDLLKLNGSTDAPVLAKTKDMMSPQNEAESQRLAKPAPVKIALYLNSYDPELDALKYASKRRPNKPASRKHSTLPTKLTFFSSSTMTNADAATATTTTAATTTATSAQDPKSKLTYPKKDKAQPLFSQDMVKDMAHGMVKDEGQAGTKVISSERGKNMGKDMSQDMSKNMSKDIGKDNILQPQIMPYSQSLYWAQRVVIPRHRLPSPTKTNLPTEIDLRQLQELESEQKQVAKLRKQVPQHYSAKELETAFNQAHTVLFRSRQQGIYAISYFEDDYPQALREAVNEEGKADPAILLFYKGNLNLLHEERKVAIIGSRTNTPLGGIAASAWAGYLAKEQTCIVSGLALGCDASAHRGALKAPQGKTMAILAHGLDQVYPPEHNSLANIILKHAGLLVSEYPCGTPVSPNNFIARDRLQAALSSATIVVQSKAHGGTLHAAKTTYQLRHPLFVIRYTQPEENLEQETYGNQLLEEKYGATPLSAYISPAQMSADVKAVLKQVDKFNQTQLFHRQAQSIKHPLKL